jgi:excisionase family DNA binding protein
MVTLTVEEFRAAVRDAVANELAHCAPLGADRVPGPANLTLHEAACELRCSIPTVRRLIARGRLRSVRTGHGGSAKTLIPRSALAAFIAGSTT